VQQGTPVLGIPANLDQLLNMHHVVAAHAGLSLRADRVSRPAVEQALRRLLSDSSFTDRARQLRTNFLARPSADLFVRALDDVLGSAN